MIAKAHLAEWVTAELEQGARPTSAVGRTVGRTGTRLDSRVATLQSSTRAAVCNRRGI